MTGLRSVVGRALDVGQGALGASAAPLFALASARHRQRLQRARHEPWAARGEDFLEHAERRDKFVYLARLSLTEGLLRPGPSAPAVDLEDAGPEMVFLGDALAVRQLGPSTFSHALCARLRRADAVCMNWEGVIGPRTEEIAPLFTARGARQLAAHARGEEDAGWCSSFDERAARTLLGLGRHTVANLANNHSLDRGGQSFATTTRWLRAHGATVTGGPGAVVFPLGAARIGLVAAGYGSNRAREPLPFLALSELTDAWLAQTARELAHCTHKVAILHWGHEYEWLPSHEQHTLLRRFAAHGFAAVVGHHPHVVQPHFRVGDTWASPSLGDFIGGDRTPFSRLGVALSLRFLPNGTVHGQPFGLAQTASWASAAKVMLLAEAPVFERTLARCIARARRSPLFGEARS